MKESRGARLIADERRAGHVADTLKALAHPVRLRIVAILCEADETVGELAQRLALKQAIVSQQLRVLRMARLVDTARERGFVRYSLAEPRLRELVRCLEGCRVR
jgi:DNA-binding transcriptional ArsR family regulator